MATLRNHPEIDWIERTGYPSWMQEDENEVRCDECGRIIEEWDDVYECRTHSTLCLECLKMLHKKYV